MGLNLVCFVLLIAEVALSESSPLSVAELPLEHRGHEDTESVDLPSNFAVLLLEQYERNAANIDAKIPLVTPTTFSIMRPDGSYIFALSTNDQWRTESRFADGEVIGDYGYKMPDGNAMHVKYTAGHAGYQADVKTIQQDNTKLSEPLPYGAALLRYEPLTRLNDDNIKTYDDTEAQAVITEVLA